MKIFSVSDMHGNLKDLDPTGCDIVVIAGDIAPLNGFSKWHIHDQKDWIQDKFMQWIDKYQNIDFLIVPGNHDKCLDPATIINYPGMNWNISWSKNAHLLIDRYVEVKGLKVYGMPWVPTISHTWAFESNHEKLKHKCSLIPEGLDILITHAPPRIPDHGIDRSIQYGGYDAFGSDELAQAIFEKRPKNLFCGHIHSGTHNGIKFENCACYNVSRVDEDYQIAYEPTIIEI